jgi:biopolymer transport protein ExbD
MKKLIPILFVCLFTNHCFLFGALKNQEPINIDYKKEAQELYTTTQHIKCYIDSTYDYWRAIILVDTATNDEVKNLSKKKYLEDKQYFLDKVKQESRQAVYDKVWRILNKVPKNDFDAITLLTMINVESIMNQKHEEPRLTYIKKTFVNELASCRNLK